MLACRALGARSIELESGRTRRRASRWTTSPFAKQTARERCATRIAARQHCAINRRAPQLKRAANEDARLDGGPDRLRLFGHCSPAEAALVAAPAWDVWSLGPPAVPCSARSVCSLRLFGHRSRAARRAV